MMKQSINTVGYSNINNTKNSEELYRLALNFDEDEMRCVLKAIITKRPELIFERVENDFLKTMNKINALNDLLSTFEHVNKKCNE